MDFKVPSSPADSENLMSRFGYTLRLTVQDCGLRTFQAQSDELHGADPMSQWDMSGALAYDLKRAFEIMNNPPSISEMCLALDSDGCGPFYMLAKTWDAWEQEVGDKFTPDVIEVTVNLDKLDFEDESARNRFKMWCKVHRWQWKESGPCASTAST